MVHSPIRAFTLTILYIAGFFACAPSRTTTQLQANASPDATAPNAAIGPDQRATYDEAILQRGADLNRTEDFGNTLLTRAVATGEPDVAVVKLLLAAGLIQTLRNSESEVMVKR